MLYVTDDPFKNVYLGFKKVEICRVNFSSFSMRFLIPSFKTSINVANPVISGSLLVFFSRFSSDLN